MSIFHFGDVIGGGQVWWVSINLQSNKVIVIGQFFHIFMSEVSCVIPSLVAPLSRQDDGIVVQTNIQSNPPFHVDHGNAIY